ncbi:MAG TPA: BMA_0021/BMA_0022 family TOMM bacteriocin, partial [Polyangiaceae bacterium]|nr:BMA_0021/BMA_0022 family TOMM bacteriocin [Polyangiaceae bacterium]
VVVTLRGLALHTDGEHDEARRALGVAVELYDPALHRDHAARFGLDSFVMATTMSAQLRWSSGDDEAAFGLVATALGWAREVGHVPSLALGLLYGCQVFQFAGDKATVAAMTGELLALAAKYGLPAYEGYAVVVHGWATGEDARADAILQGLAGMGCKLGLSYFGSLPADADAERGELDAAVARLDRCLALCRDNDEHYYEPELHRRKAMYLLRQGPAGGPARAAAAHAPRRGAGDARARSPLRRRRAARGAPRRAILGPPRPAHDRNPHDPKGPPMSTSNLVDFRTTYLRAIAQAWVDPAFLSELTRKGQGAQALKAHFDYEWPWGELALTFRKNGAKWKPAATGGWYGSLRDAIVVNAPLTPARVKGLLPEYHTRAIAAYYQQRPTFLGPNGKPAHQGPSLNLQAYDPGLGSWDSFLHLGAATFRAVALAWHDEAFRSELCGNGVRALEGWLGYNSP